MFAEAVASLPEEVREAFLMRKMDGLKFKQIALRLDVSVSTVEKRVAAALLHCARHLRRNGYAMDGQGDCQVGQRLQIGKTGRSDGRAS